MRRKKSLLNIAMQAELQGQQNEQTKEEFINAAKRQASYGCVEWLKTDDMLRSMGTVEKFCVDNMHRTLVDLIAAIKG